MIKRFVVIALLSPAISIASEELAIKKTNFDSELEYYSNDFFYAYSLSGIANIPINNSIGTNLIASYRDSEGRHHENGRGIGSARKSLGISLFIRNQSTGKFGLTYSYSKTKHNFEQNQFTDNDNKVDSEIYNLYADYYADNITLSAARAYTNNDYHINQYRTQTWLTWYIAREAKTELTAYRFDSENSYEFSLTFQPNVLRNSSSFSVTFLQNNRNHNLNTMTVSFQYHIGSPVSLIDRDRQYH